MLWAEFSSMSKSQGSLLPLSPACHLSGINLMEPEKEIVDHIFMHLFILPSIRHLLGTSVVLLGGTSSSSIILNPEKNVYNITPTFTESRQLLS